MPVFCIFLLPSADIDATIETEAVKQQDRMNNQQKNPINIFRFQVWYNQKEIKRQGGILYASHYSLE